jgi:hypothetical protein
VRPPRVGHSPRRWVNMRTFLLLIVGLLLTSVALAQDGETDFSLGVTVTPTSPVAGEDFVITVVVNPAPTPGPGYVAVTIWRGKVPVKTHSHLVSGGFEGESPLIRGELAHGDYTVVAALFPVRENGELGRPPYLVSHKFTVLPTPAPSEQAKPPPGKGLPRKGGVEVG